MVDALLVMALLPIGMRLVSSEGMILAAFGRRMDKLCDTLPDWIAKPLWCCERCMVSLWGIPAALFVHFAPWWACIPIVAVCAAGLQDLLDR